MSTPQEMKSLSRYLDAYGKTAFRYEGSGRVIAAHSGQAEGFFDARFMESGYLYVGIFLPRPPFDENTGIFNARDIVQIAFSTQNHEYIETDGPFIVLLASSHEFVFQAERYVVQIGDMRSAYEARLPLFNFSFRQRRFQTVRSYQFDLGSLQVLVEDPSVLNQPILHRSARSGAEVTAVCVVRTTDERPLNLDADQLDKLTIDIVHAFSLALGTRVACTTIEALDESQDIVCRFHRSTSIPAFSPLILAADWIVDVEMLTKVWFDGEQDPLISTSDLGRAVELFTDACSIELNLETRCLAACCLLDGLSLRIAEEKREEHVVSSYRYETAILPQLRDYADQILSLAGLPSNQADQLRAKLSGLNRRSFRQRLRILIDEFDIPMTSTQLEQIVAVRNALVHIGEFPSQRLHGAVSFFSFVGPERAMGFHDYKIVVWATYCTLLRLVGYHEDLPDPLAPPMYDGASREI